MKDEKICPESFQASMTKGEFIFFEKKYFFEKKNSQQTPFFQNMEIEFGESFAASSSSSSSGDCENNTIDDGNESELTSEDDLPFDSTKLSSLIDILGKKGSVRRFVEDEQEDVSPFHILQRLFGPVCERVKVAYNDTVNNYDEVMVEATNVLSTAPVRVFTDLDTRNIKNREFKNEVMFFETCDQPLERTSPTVVTLMQDLAAMRTCDRQALSAQFLTIVHAIRDIVGSQLKHVTFVMGSDAKILRRTKTAEVWATALKNQREILRSLILGDFDKRYKRGFIYEVLAALVSPDLQLRNFTDLILSSEYHVVRAAVDAVHSEKLFVCVLSSEYIQSVWLPYMQLYYPRMFKGHKENAAPLTWTSLKVYLPKKKHLIDEINDGKLSSLLSSIFQHDCSDEFLQNIKKVDVPDAYSYVSEAFETHNVRPKRHGIPRKDYTERKKKPRN